MENNWLDHQLNDVDHHNLMDYISFFLFGSIQIACIPFILNLHLFLTVSYTQIPTIINDSQLELSDKDVFTILTIRNMDEYFQSF